MTMTRTTLGAAALAGALATALTPAGEAAAETTLRLSHFLPPVHGIHTDFIVPWTEAIEACTDGEVTFEIFPGGTQLGNVARQQEQVLAGVVDVAHGLTGIPRGRFPRTSLIDLPFLTEDAGVASQALWAIFPDHLAEEYEGLEVLALHAHNGGLIHTRETEVREPSDLEGLRIRTPSPAISMMLEEVGAVPQGMPPGQVYENLQKGVIDGTVFPWDPVASFRLAEVLENHTDAGAYTVSFFFVMNERSYAQLSEEARACIDEHSGDALVSRFGEWWDAWDAPGRAAAVEKGNTIIELSDDEREAWREALQPVHDKYVAGLEEEAPDIRAVYEALQAEIAERAGE
jgi:TRAP-type C4-dicarboxylate transport system substrate-binding protein